jgi:hypothetical protein
LALLDLKQALGRTAPAILGVEHGGFAVEPPQMLAALGFHAIDAGGYRKLLGARRLRGLRPGFDGGTLLGNAPALGSSCLVCRPGRHGRHAGQQSDQ